MADDAGALLVRSGLVSSSALEEARARNAKSGGTIGEQLVAAGAVDDQTLTDFYRTRLLVPQVNPNTLARLPVKVIAAIPNDMAIELRAIPISLDADNNLTVAMSDPSDRHAVDEIAFFTGSYVVRAVATQLQIAWCLAHYYGHLTELGQTLIQSSTDGVPREGQSAIAHEPAAKVEAPLPRTKGLTGKVDASRHRAIAPITGPLDILQPRSEALERPAQPGEPLGAINSPAIVPVAVAPAAVDPVAVAPVAVDPVNNASVDPAAPDADSDDDDRPRARSVSGEIRVPFRRAASIRPALPEPDPADDSGPVITVELAADEPTVRRKTTTRRRVRTDPPELAARAGEVDISSSPERSVDLDEPRIIVSDDALDRPTPQVEAAGELRVVSYRNDSTPPATTIEVDDTSVGVVIHEHYTHESEPVLLDHVLDHTLERRPTTDRPVTGEPTVTTQRAPDHADDPPDHDVVVLDARKRSAPVPAGSARGELVDKRPRPERRTQVGVGVTAAITRSHRDTEVSGVPGPIEDVPTGEERHPAGSIANDGDITTVALRAVEPAPGDSTDATIEPPPPDLDDTNQHLALPTERALGHVSASDARAANDRVHDLEDDDDDDDTGARDNEDVDSDDIQRGTVTTVMSEPELDEAIPQRTAELTPAHLASRGFEYDALDDGWGPPGTTIPPPLLGALPGSEDDSDDDDDDSPQSLIPMSRHDSALLFRAPPSPPEPTRGTPAAPEVSGPSLVRVLEDATARALELIRSLERAHDRDRVVQLMIAHLAASHHRAGFFYIKQSSSKGSSRPNETRLTEPRPGSVTSALGDGELGVFAIEPRAPLSPATLRLDQPSTLQDVVDTRLPYRGPMHDDASRTFLARVLGACPPEILLVPVAIRERVVGVLFGDHRLRHTFDDQLALAARAAGMALERILKSKRG